MEAAGIIGAALLLAQGRPSPPPPPPRAELRIALSNLRSARGVVLICLSASARHFPDCGRDPAARTLRLPAASAAAALFTGIPPGRYALSVMHDENGNARLDTVMGIPREGFGFSRNPAVRFGPPKFSQVRFAVGPGPATVPVRMKYFL